VHVKVPEGLKADAVDLGPIESGTEKEFSIEVSALPSAPAGKIVSLQVTPETDGRRGRPLEVPVAIGVCVVDVGSRNRFEVTTPNYTAVIPKAYGTIINLEDASGLRRSAANETGLNHWGFPAAGAPQGDRRIFGINGGVSGSGQPVKLLMLTSNGLMFERVEPSANQLDGPPEKLRYHFAADHIAMAVETMPGKTFEMTLGAFERHLARETVLHWSDGEITDFGVDAIGATYHRFPLDHRQWKAADWVFFRQGGAFDRTAILLEFPAGSEVYAGTHSQLYFKVKVESGEWVKMYLLSKEEIAVYTGGKLDLK